METQPILSPRIQQLQTALTHGDYSELRRFWSEINATGAPIIEPINGSLLNGAIDALGAKKDNEKKDNAKKDNAKKHSFVTFVWRDDGHTNSVAVIQDWGADGVPEHLMTRIPNSDVWYKTRILPSDTRTTYQLSPSTRRTGEDGDYQTDPLNRKTHRALWSEDGNDIIFSLLELPDAPAQPWKREIQVRGSIELHTPTADGRRVWVYKPIVASKEDCPLLVCFDGRSYKDTMEIPAMLDHLTLMKRIPPTVVLFIDNPDRNVELPCNPAFADKVAQQIIPWAQENYPVTRAPARTLVTGSSYGGLAAAYCGLRHPQIFGNVLSQTGWFRWKPEGEAEYEWLTRQFVDQPLLPVRFYLDVGMLEEARMNDLGPTQLVANRHLRDVLRAKGYQVQYREYSGGHDYSSLQNPLFDVLPLLLNE